MWKETRKIFRQHTAGAVAFCVVLAIILVALLAPYIAPRDPYEYDVMRRFEAPSGDYLVGTDNMGRCVLSRAIWGTRISLQVGLTASLIGAFMGLVMGVVAGYSGSTVEAILMRIVDVGLSFPFILLAILITAFFGGGLTNVMIAVGIARAPRMARIAHAATRQVRENEYIEASRAVGANHIRIMSRHILPNIAAPVIVRFTLDVAIAILAESSLSFLGMGITPPTPTWGGIIAVGREHLRRAPWIASAAGTAIFVTVLSINVLGDGVRDYLDPKVGV